MSEDLGNPDSAIEARHLSAWVLSCLHADAAPEHAYPDVPRAQAVAAVEKDLAEAYAAYHKHLIDHRDELAQFDEFAADYGEIDEPAPVESRWTAKDLTIIPLGLLDDPPF